MFFGFSCTVAKHMTVWLVGWLAAVDVAVSVDDNFIC